MSQMMGKFTTPVPLQVALGFVFVSKSGEIVWSASYSSLHGLLLDKGQLMKNQERSPLISWMSLICSQTCFEAVIFPHSTEFYPISLLSYLSRLPGKRILSPWGYTINSTFCHLSTTTLSIFSFSRSTWTIKSPRSFLSHGTAKMQGREGGEIRKFS